MNFSYKPLPGQKNSDLKKPARPWWQDLSLWSLLLANALMIYSTIQYQVPLMSILLVYWFQSVTVGIFNYWRLRKLKNFSTAGNYSNGLPVEPTEAAKKSTANFFAFHYGIFHFAYLWFILIFLFIGTIDPYFAKTFGSVDIWATLILAAVFFINHLFSFLYSYKDLTNGGNLGQIMLSPYPRILPMHLTLIIIFVLGSGSLLFFLLLKALMDLFGHVMKNKRVGFAQSVSN